MSDERLGTTIHSEDGNANQTGKQNISLASVENNKSKSDINDSKNIPRENSFISENKYDQETRMQSTEILSSNCSKNDCKDSDKQSKRPAPSRSLQCIIDALKRTKQTSNAKNANIISGVEISKKIDKHPASLAPVVCANLENTNKSKTTCKVELQKNSLTVIAANEGKVDINASSEEQTSHCVENYSKVCENKSTNISPLENTISDTSKVANKNKIVPIDPIKLDKFKSLKKAKKRHSKLAFFNKDSEDSNSIGNTNKEQQDYKGNNTVTPEKQ